MRLLFFALTILFSTSLWSQGDWRAITPLDYCQKLQIEYQVTSDGEYKVRIPGPAGPRQIDQRLEDINDLSSLTDILVDESVKVCGGGKAVLRVESDAIIFEERDGQDYHECLSPLVYSEPYLDLTREMVGILQFNGNRCDQLMAFTELQTKITQLSDEDLIKLEKPRLGHRFLKLFTDKDTDELVNLYNTCGGEKFTDKFVANLILIEAKNACVMPRPPGIFSFAQTKEIAMDVAKDFNGLSLMKMNSKKGKITERAIKALTQKGLKIEIESLLGPQIEDVDSFVADLDAVKELNQVDFEENGAESLGLGFTFDATMEVAQKAVPILAKGSFKDKLPPDWSESEKDRYFDSEFLPAVEDTYASCMSEHFEKSGFGQNLSLDQKLKKREALKANYCKNHPEQCRGKSCGESINILSGDPKISDAQVAQGCVMKSMLEAVKPTMKLSILAQREKFKKDFDLTDRFADELANRGYETLLQCANNKIVKESSGPRAILDEPEHLQSISAPKFESVLLECANTAEVGIARVFYAKTLLNQKALRDAYPKDVSESARQAPRPELLRDVEEILGRTYDPCISKQQANSLKNSGTAGVRDPLLCVPIVEIAAATKVIKSSIEKTYEESGMSDNPQGLLSMKEFENCADRSLKGALNSLRESESTVEVPINTEIDAENFLQKNNQFYSCVKDAIVNTAGTVGDKMFDEKTAEMADQLENPDFLKGLKNGAMNATQKCFKDKLDGLENWKGFMSFNEADGLAQLQDECAVKAVDYVLPKTLIKETADKMAPLREENFLVGHTEVGNTLAGTAFHLRRKYGLDLPSHLKGDSIVEWSFAQAHNEHSKTQGNDTTTFVDEYTQVVMDKAIAAIHKNVAAKVEEMGKEDFSSFFQAAPPQCLHKVFTKFEPQISGLIEEMNKMPKDENITSAPLVDEISQLILSGLRYQKGLGASAYKNKIADIENACKNIDSFEGPMDLAQTEAFDFILKGVVQNRLFDTFDEVVTEQCIEGLKEQIGDPNAPSLEEVCGTRNLSDAEAAFQETLSAFPKKKAIIDFIKNRHLQMIDVLTSKFKNSKETEKIVFQGEPRVIDFIHENFKDILTEDKDTMQTLNTSITKKLFNDKSKDSFANQFVKIQVTNGLGIAGHKKAYDALNISTIDDAVGWLDFGVDKGKVLAVSREALAKKWTPAGVEELLHWDRINDRTREGLINSVYENAVLPAAQGKEFNDNKIADDITRHVQSYKNPHDGKTYEERLTEEISGYVNERKKSVLGLGDCEMIWQWLPVPGWRLQC